MKRDVCEAFDVRNQRARSGCDRDMPRGNRAVVDAQSPLTDKARFAENHIDAEAAKTVRRIMRLDGRARIADVTHHRGEIDTHIRGLYAVTMRSAGIRGCPRARE